MYLTLHCQRKWDIHSAIVFTNNKQLILAKKKERKHAFSAEKQIQAKQQLNSVATYWDRNLLRKSEMHTQDSQDFELSVSWSQSLSDKGKSHSEKVQEESFYCKDWIYKGNTMST